MNVQPKHLQYQRYVETHNSTCEESGGGGSGDSLQVPQNSLNSKKGPERDKEKASLARLSWFGNAAVGRVVFGSAVVITILHYSQGWII